MRVLVAMASVLLLRLVSRCGAEQATATSRTSARICHGTEFGPAAQQSSFSQPVNVLRIHLDGCSSAASEFRAARLTFTVEPASDAANATATTTTVSTVPPNVLEPVYSSVRNVGFLSFRVTNVTTQPTLQSAEVHVQIPHDQLSYVSVEYGNPFYVQVLPGFTRVSTLALSTGYSLIRGPVLGLGLQLKADLSSSTVPLSVQVNGNGAVIELVVGSVVESLQFSGLGSRIGLRGTVACTSNAQDCYVEGGTTASDGNGNDGDATTVLLQGSVQGTIAARTSPSSSIHGPDAWTLLVNDPTAAGDHTCAAFVPADGDDDVEGGARCQPTNRTASVEPWFPCGAAGDSSSASASASSAEAVVTPVGGTSYDENAVWCSSSGSEYSNNANGGACSCAVQVSRSTAAPLRGSSRAVAASPSDRLLGAAMAGAALLTQLV